MSFSFVYNPHSPNGRQYEIRGSRQDVIAALMARGLNETDATIMVNKACRSARANGGASDPIRAPARQSQTLTTDRELVARFIGAVYQLTRDASVTFASVYGEFLKWLDPGLKSLWNARRFSNALPAEHRSVPGTGNRRIIHGLSRRRKSPIHAIQF